MNRTMIASRAGVSLLALGILTCFLILPGSPIEGAPPTKMYWTHRTPAKVQRADLSGSNVEDLVTGLSSSNDNST